MAVRTPLLLAALSALPVAAIAQTPSDDVSASAQKTRSDDLSYTYLEADYVNLAIDEPDDDASLLEDLDDGNGWAIRGSFAFTPKFFGYAGYASTEADATFTDPDELVVPANTDIERLDVGLGINIPLSFSGRTTDFVARVGYVDVDFGDFDFGASGSDSLDDLTEDSSDGWSADATLRSQLTTRLEGSVGAGYLDIDGADGFSFLAGVMFELTPNWGINLDANIGDDLSTYNLGVRYSFARF